MRIPWSEPETKAVYERMVSVLIKRVYPTADRVDGSGGDGGRDVQVHTDEGLAIFELKSFTGRLSTGGRKKQIAKSLTRAMNLNPARWSVVAPIDLTPEERTWFEKLVRDNEVDGKWLGLTWLDNEMAQRPDIARYFLEGQSKEVLRLLRELRSEDLALDNSLAAIDRARTIQRQLNDADPYFKYDFAIGGGRDHSRRPGVALSVTMGADRIDVVPRYRTALNDRPITVTADLDFSEDADGHRQAFENAVRFGDPATLPATVVRRLQIDAPAGLSSDVQGAEIRFLAPDVPLDEVQLVHVAVLAPDGETRLAVQEFEVTHRRGGSDGGTLTGRDASGMLSITIRMDRITRSTNINISTDPVPVYPAVGLAVAQWIDEIRPPNLLNLDFIGHETNATPVPIDERLAPGPIAPLFDAFAKLQARAGVTFPVPTDITDEEWDVVSKVAEWLSPEKRQYRWSHHEMTITPTDVQALRDLFREEGGSLMVAMDITVEFRGRMLELGRLARTFHGKAVGGIRAFEDAIARGDEEMDVRIEPADTDIAYEWLMDDEEPSP